nr:MAG TPA_asm: hypothetical protein [Caudoviricetes sp.]
MNKQFSLNFQHWLQSCLPRKKSGRLSPKKRAIK